MATQLQSERLAYVLRRKEFFNEKTFVLFEKFQFIVFAYVAYVLAILTALTKGDWTDTQATVLIWAADLFLGLAFSVFLIFVIINVASWWRYEKEENSATGNTLQLDFKSLITWFEVWIVIAAVFEIAGLYFIKSIVQDSFF